MKVDLAGHAEEYASLGWALVHLDGKMPIGYGWQKAEPLEPDVAKDIWAGREGNMGLVLGPSGVIDFELDGGDADLYYSLIEEVETPRYVTGSGKPHTLFRDPGNMTRRTRDGMELRAGHHQSVIPPSIHPDTGEAYYWVCSPQTPLADPPQALLDYFAEEAGGKNEGNWREALKGEKLGKGQGRHQSLVSYMGLAVNQFDDFGTFVAAAIAFASVTQDPPYPDEEIEQWALRIWNAYKDESEGEPEEGLKVVRATDISLRSISFLWRPFLQRSAFHLLVGKKGAGKGSMLTWLAAQMTQGFLDEEEGTVAEPRAVLWVSTEDSFEIDVKPRFLAQGGDTDLLLCVRQRVLLPLDEEKLHTTCVRNNVGMVIIDPIISALAKGSDANDEASVVSAIGCLNALADELDLTILGVRHLGKSLDRSPLEAVLGSAAWINTPRAVLGLAQDEDSKVATLEILAGNRVRGRVSFDFKVNEAMVTGVAEPVSKVDPIGQNGTSMESVLSRKAGAKLPEVTAWLEEKLSGGQELVKEDLVSECYEKFGVGRASIDKAATDLKEKGVLRFIPGEIDPLTGRKKAGAPWKMRLAVPGDL